MAHKYGFDAATDFLYDHGENMRRGGFMTVRTKKEEKVKATDLASSGAEIGGTTTGTQTVRIDLRKVADVLAENGMDPTAEIVKILPLLEPELKARVMLEMLNYCQPKLKAVEINATVTEMSSEERQKRLMYLLEKVNGSSESGA